MTKESALTLENLEETLANDTKVKVAAVDIDGLLRGKVMHKDKFLHVAKDGFGKCTSEKKKTERVALTASTAHRILLCYLWLGYSG